MGGLLGPGPPVPLSPFSRILLSSPHAHREAKRTLPRPKVGDFCTNAMEQGFSDACVSLCMEQRPVIRVAQTCRAAAVEMPRPTVRKWCEHGYNTAFEKTREDLLTHFKHVAEEAPRDVEQEQEQQSQEEPVQAEAAAPMDEAVPAEPVAAVQQEAVAEQAATKSVVAKIPVTIGGSDMELLLHEGESAEDAVVAFCRENVTEDVSACIRQMLPEVLERMEADGAAGGSGLRGSSAH